MIDTSILIVDDHALFADVVASALQRAGARVIGPVSTAADAIASVAAERPGLVLLDLGLPDLPGFDLARAILAVQPDVPILALSASTDDRMPAQAVKAGLRGYVPKDAPFEAMLDAIRDALDGRVAVVPFHRRRSELAHRSAPNSLIVGDLTEREQEVLGSVVAGMGTREIARVLGISTNTVRTHVQSILTKLHVHSRLEAAALAVRLGFTGGGIDPIRGGEAAAPRVLQGP